MNQSHKACVKKITKEICAIAFHTSLCDKHMFVGNFTQICVKLTSLCEVLLHTGLV
jgi:hypothetical protein